MADYHPLIAKAVAGLDRKQRRSPGRALYEEDARNALALHAIARRRRP